MQSLQVRFSLTIFCLLLTSFQAFAMAPAPPPRATDEPTAALPSVCRFDPVLRIPATARTRFVSGLDRGACVYTHETFSKSMAQIQNECAAVVAREGLDLNGTWRCIDSTFRIPNIRVGCRFPDQDSFPQTFDVEYRFANSEIPQRRCEKISNCILNDLRDPAESINAQQWFNKLGCR